MVEVKMPHAGHEKHLCFLLNLGYFSESDLDEYKKLVRKASCVCKECGRVAAGEKSLCEPEKL